VLKGDQRSSKRKGVREGLYIVEWRGLKKKYDKKEERKDIHAYSCSNIYLSTELPKNLVPI
jgi:hypothetical protein